MAKFRISIDVEVNLEEFNKESILEDLKRYSSHDDFIETDYFDKDVELQEDLFKAIISNKRTLSNLLIACALDELEVLNPKEIHDSLDMQFFDDIITEAALNFDKVDNNYFRNKQKEGLLSEHLEHVYSRFKSRTINIEIEKTS